MKKAILIALVTVFAWALVLASEKLSALDEAKNLALKGSLDQDGDYLLTRRGRVGETPVGYAFCYAPKTGKIYIARSEGSGAVVLLADREKQVFVISIFERGIQVGQVIVDLETAERFAAKILLEIDQWKIVME